MQERECLLRLFQRHTAASAATVGTAVAAAAVSAAVAVAAAAAAVSAASAAATVAIASAACAAAARAAAALAAATLAAAALALAAATLRAAAVAAALTAVAAALAAAAVAAAVTPASMVDCHVHAWTRAKAARWRVHCVRLPSEAQSEPDGRRGSRLSISHFVRRFSDSPELPQARPLQPPVPLPPPADRVGGRQALITV